MYESDNELVKGKDPTVKFDNKNTLANNRFKLVNIVSEQLGNINYGDLNNDGTADLTDLTLLSLYLLKAQKFSSYLIEAADIDGSGEVDIADLAYFKQYVCMDKSVLSKIRIK